MLLSSTNPLVIFIIISKVVTIIVIFATLLIDNTINADMLACTLPFCREGHCALTSSVMFDTSLCSHCIQSPSQIERVVPGLSPIYSQLALFQLSIIAISGAWSICLSRACLIVSTSKVVCQSCFCPWKLA